MPDDTVVRVALDALLERVRAALPDGGGPDAAVALDARAALAQMEAELRRLTDREQRLTLGASHARARLDTLADASRVLAESNDRSEASLRLLVDGLVPGFADWAAMLRAGDGPDAGVHMLSAAGSAVVLPELALAGIQRLATRGKARLLVHGGPERLSPRPSEVPLMKALRSSGLASCIVAPVAVRGLTFGALLVATAAGSRGYRPSDLAVVEELARRISLSIESDLLYREAEVSAAAADAHADRLRGLVEVLLEVGASAEPEDALRLAQSGAARLLEPAQVMVVTTAGPLDTQLPLSAATVRLLTRRHGLTGSGDPERPALAAADEQLLGPHWMAAGLTGPDGTSTGTVLAYGSRVPFAADDESLLLLFARMVAAVHAQATLVQRNRATVAELRTLFAASPVALVQLDDNLQAIGHNPAAAELFGWSGPRSRALPPEVCDVVNDLVALPRTARTHTAQRTCTIGTGDAERSLTVRLAEVRSPHSATRQLLVVTDDTERQRLSQQFAQMQRLEAVGRLAGGIAHDFNNLLTVILGYADGMLRRLPEEDPMRDRVAAIHRASTRGARLTGQLLAISRKQVVEPVVLSPAAVLDELRGMVLRLVGERIEVKRERGGDELRVRMDRAQLEQAVLNLASNAADAMPDGGQLTVKVASSDPPARDHVDAPHGWVAVTVRDTGTGMDPDTLAHCLEPLFTTKDAGKGTGLGLATVAAVVDDVGGEVRVESAPGAGTSVTLVLPGDVGEATPSYDDTLPTPHDTAELVRRRVLLVEDDHEIRWLLWRALRERGFTTLVADSPRQALELVDDETEPIDLVVTDVAMPGMSGPQLARTLFEGRRVPVLFVSGYAEDLAGLDFDESVTTGFLAKPFTPDQLFAKVGELLGEPQGSKR